jgi:hypothetical protein
MKRWPLALLLAPVLGGCMGGSAAVPPGSPVPPAQAPRARCVAEWNGPANAAVRAAAAPPRGPYPWYAHRPIRPQGGFEVFIGFILSTGGPAGTGPAPPCAVDFWFPRGYHGRPARLSFREIDLRRGVFGRASINAGRTLRFHPEGPVYAEDGEGRLRPTDTPPPASPAALPLRGTVARCLADWNGDANASVRAGAAPPMRLPGSFQAFVGLSTVIGAVGRNPPPVCNVDFRFPHGHRGGPALVSYPEIDRRHGVYGEPSITVGNDTDVGGRIYVEDPEGRLHPTGGHRRA